MIELERIYEYEVAFSFLQQDEGIAQQINDLIQDRFKTFLYTERQKELAGTDGERKFNEIFGEQARIVIIFYRDGWGKTPWTRIEETAIRNRAHSEGYDFTTFVQLEPKSKIPIWLPKTRIYYNFDRWGIKGLAPVIEARIQEAGGINKPDTLEDQAARMKRQILLHKERQEFLNSKLGYNKAQEEFEIFIKLLDEKIKSLEDPELNLYFIIDTDNYNKVIIRCEGYSMRCRWHYAYSNTLDESGLNIDVISANQDSLNAILGSNGFGRIEESIIKSEMFNFDFNPSTQETGWSIKTRDIDFFTTEQLIEYWLKFFLGKISKIKIERQRKR
jgi:hypothetical protein